MFIIKLLSQHVSGIIMPIIRRPRVCTAAYGVLHWFWWLWLCGAGTQAVCTVKVAIRPLVEGEGYCSNRGRIVTFTVHTACVPAPHNHSHKNQCRTPYAAVHTLVLLMMGIMVPETCWDKSLIINIRLVASCWFLSLHPTFMTHGHKSLKHRTVLPTYRVSHKPELLGKRRTAVSWLLDSMWRVCRVAGEEPWSILKKLCLAEFIWKALV